MPEDTTKASESKFKPTQALDEAIADITKHKPAKWGAQEHLAMLAMLVLNASEQAASTPEQRKAEGFKVTIEWRKLRAELCQDSKLAECANFYKWLQSASLMPKATKVEAKYFDE